MRTPISRFSNNQHYFYPPEIGPVYLVKRRVPPHDPIARRPNAKHVYRSKIKRRFRYGKLEITKTKAVLDPLYVTIERVGEHKWTSRLGGYRDQISGWCRYYSVIGSGRDWDITEFNISRDEALHEIWSYREFRL